MALDQSGDLILCGGTDGVAGIFSISLQKVVHTLKGGSHITDGLWTGTRAIIATASGVVKVFENGPETASFSRHAGEVTAIALHPSGDILASVGVDASFVFYDLTTSTVATQVDTNCGWLPSHIGIVSY
jgi:pre-mRNA-processing factor 19